MGDEDFARRLIDSLLPIMMNHEPPLTFLPNIDVPLDNNIELNKYGVMGTKNTQINMKKFDLWNLKKCTADNLINENIYRIRKALAAISNDETNEIVHDAVTTAIDHYGLEVPPLVENSDDEVTSDTDDSEEESLFTISQPGPSQFTHNSRAVMENEYNNDLEDNFLSIAIGMAIEEKGLTIDHK